MKPDRLRAALVVLPDREWLCGALVRVAEKPRTIGGFYALAARRCGHMALPAALGWTADVAARVLLLTVLPLSGRPLTDAIRPLYQFGDACEKLPVLRALPMLDVGDTAVPLVRTAIDSKDPRLMAAAVGPYADHLDDTTWRDAVLMCIRTGVPLAAIHNLHRRADPHLALMLAEHVDQRRAAGLHVAADAVALHRRLTDPDTRTDFAEYPVANTAGNTRGTLNATATLRVTRWRTEGTPTC